ncbi:MAG TPA: hypothetical protein VF691_19235, partial [Cytophagaceae bacterium]
EAHWKYINEPEPDMQDIETEFKNLLDKYGFPAINHALTQATFNSFTMDELSAEEVRKISGPIHSLYLTFFSLEYEDRPTLYIEDDKKHFSPYRDALESILTSYVKRASGYRYERYSIDILMDLAYIFDFCDLKKSDPERTTETLIKSYTNGNN